MGFFSGSKRLNWWEELDRDFPPGSAWMYMGRRCQVLRTHSWSLDGLPYGDFKIQYTDDHGVIHTTVATPSGLTPCKPVNLDLP